MLNNIIFIIIFIIFIIIIYYYNIFIIIIIIISYLLIIVDLSEMRAGFLRNREYARCYSRIVDRPLPPFSVETNTPPSLIYIDL